MNALVVGGSGRPRDEQLYGSLREGGKLLCFRENEEKERRPLGREHSPGYSKYCMMRLCREGAARLVVETVPMVSFQYACVPSVYASTFTVRSEALLHSKLPTEFALRQLLEVWRGYTVCPPTCTYMCKQAGAAPVRRMPV